MSSTAPSTPGTKPPATPTPSPSAAKKQHPPKAAAASLDLAYVAAGRLDGFWEFGLSPWDMAAGALLIMEAGGLVGDLAGESNYLATGNIVAGNPKVFGALLPIVQAHRTAQLRA